MARPRSISALNSVPAALFAGILALADQLAGHSVDLVNPALCAMYSAPDKRGLSGYDLASGLGTVKAALFVPEPVASPSWRRLARRSKRSCRRQGGGGQGHDRRVGVGQQHLAAGRAARADHYRRVRQVLQLMLLDHQLAGALHGAGERVAGAHSARGAQPPGRAGADSLGHRSRV
jgi:hypothetical protein